MNSKLWTFLIKLALVLGLSSSAWAGNATHPQPTHVDSDTAVSAQITTPYEHDKSSVQRIKMSQEQKEALKARREQMRKARETMLEKHREENKPDPKKRNTEFQSADKSPNQNREQKKAANASDK